jgi:hypothetical protein
VHSNGEERPVVSISSRSMGKAAGVKLAASPFSSLAAPGAYGQIPLGLSVTPLLLAHVLAVPDVP